jgi:hypothetical protein
MLDELREQMPHNHVSSSNKVLTIDVWLGDLPITFESLAAWIGFEQRQLGRGFWRYYGLKSDAAHLQLLDPHRYGTIPSTRWVEVDLAANWDKENGVAPNDVRDPKNSAGLQVMTALAVHPTYPLAMDGKTIPYSWLPGLKTVRDSGDCPLIGIGSKRPQVHLDTNDGTRRLRHYAVPVFSDV